MMEFLNFVEDKKISKKRFLDFVKILFPFAPHISQEMWVNLGMKGFLDYQKWPKYDEKLLKKEKKIIIVQVNGKKRDEIEIDPTIDEEEIQKIALEREKIKKFIKKKKIKKIIYVKERVLNFVVE
jgi:leucyl-tRNA synthetase